MEQHMRHFLVPLDGSRLAESVLPTVEYMASRCPTRVTLLHIIEQRPPTRIHGERHLCAIEEAQAYLEAIAARLRTSSTEVVTHVHEDRADNVAQGIFEHAQELQTDMVIMCTHGSSGWRGLLFGSIAQQALQRGTQSILLVLPKEDGSAPDFQLRRLLVPLDGTTAHEPALPVALSLARTFGAQVHLVFVVPTIATLTGEQAVSGLLLPRTMKEVLDLAQQGAEDYLKSVATQCRAEGVVTTTEVLRGNAVSTVLDLTERMQIDLVVMASHGRAGLDAQLKGSVAPRMIGRVGRQLLLVRAGPPEKS